MEALNRAADKQLTDLLEEARKLKEGLRIDKAKLVDARLGSLNDSISPLQAQSAVLNMRQRRLIKVPGAAVCFDWSPDRRRMVLTCKSSTVTVWDVFSGQKELEFRTSYNSNTSCSFAPSTTAVAVSGTADNVTVVQVEDPGNGQRAAPPTRVASHLGSILDCTFFASNQQLLTASADCHCGLWDVETKGAVKMFAGHTGEVLSIALNPGNPFSMFATSSADNSVRVWDPRTGECEMRFATHEAPVNQVRFFPTADALGTASSDGTCRLFDMRADQEITIFSKGSIVLGASTLDFAKSGRILFVGYDDSIIRVWDVLKESLVGVWCAHGDRVSQVQVTPDGMALGSASWDKTMKVWA